MREAAQTLIQLRDRLAQIPVIVNDLIDREPFSEQFVTVLLCADADVPLRLRSSRWLRPLDAKRLDQLSDEDSNLWLQCRQAPYSNRSASIGFIRAALRAG